MTPTATSPVRPPRRWGTSAVCPQCKELQAAIVKTKGMTRMAVADASLVCAERLLAEGQRAQALELYASLSAPGMPKSARLAAMQGIIREETSTSRPR